MLVFRGFPERAAAPCVLTIGNFDGVHRGHQALLERLVREARERGLAATVLTFEPHPREFFAPESAPPRLSRLREKLELLAASGVDRTHVLRFDEQLAGIEARSFVERLLADRLRARHILIGDDFRFGQKRAGSFALLQEMGPSLGFSVESMHTLDFEGERVSSSAVRDALAEGDLPHAQRLLGRPYVMSGRVLHGNKLGRQLGFPTANIQIKRGAQSPLQGIFTVSVEGIAARPWPAVASLGVRPTVTEDRRATLEVHLFDYDGDLYGRHLRVNFLRKQRDEAKYATLEALTAQIARDCDEARAFFAHNPL